MFDGLDGVGKAMVIDSRYNYLSGSHVLCFCSSMTRRKSFFDLVGEVNRSSIYFFQDFSMPGSLGKLVLYAVRLYSRSVYWQSITRYDQELSNLNLFLASLSQVSIHPNTS